MEKSLLLLTPGIFNYRAKDPVSSVFIVRMVEKNMKEEEESGLEERRAREQLGEGVEVGHHRLCSAMAHLFTMVFRLGRLIWCGEQTTHGIRSVVFFYPCGARS